MNLRIVRKINFPKKSLNFKYFSLNIKIYSFNVNVFSLKNQRIIFNIERNLQNLINETKMQSLFLIIMSNVEIQRKVVSNSKNNLRISNNYLQNSNIQFSFQTCCLSTQIFQI